MNIFLLFPMRYSITSSLKNVLESIPFRITILDFNDLLKQKWRTKINTQIFRLPYTIRLRWENYYFNLINKYYIDEIKSKKPDIIFVYNNQMLHPDTTKWIKDKGIKLYFYLADSPFYTPTNRFNLKILEDADAIFAPDTFWIEQLHKIGLKNLHYLILPINSEDYYKINDNQLLNEIPSYDVFYLGMSYKNAWGYKKAKFFNEFTNTNLKIIGDDAWKRWFAYFPDLANFYEEKKSYFSCARLNLIYNNSKLIPIDGNPAIINGIHVRVFEALSANTLPFMEWNKDIDMVFDDMIDMPYVKTYTEIKEKVRYFLENDNIRKNKILEMRKVLEEKYSINGVASFLKSIIYK